MSMKQLLTLLAAVGAAAVISVVAPVYATEHSEGTTQPPQATEESPGQAQESPGVAGRPGEAIEGAEGPAAPADPAATESEATQPRQ